MTKFKEVARILGYIKNLQKNNFKLKKKGEKNEKNEQL